MSKASKKDMEALHGALTRYLADAVSGSVKDADGNPVPPSPALLNVARQMLKDNHIEGPAVEGSDLKRISNNLPKFDDVDDSASNYTPH